MIKGVSRQIIEVTDTDNMYYEKAYLIVRPEYKNAQQDMLKKQAYDMVYNMEAPSVLRKTRFIAYKMFRFILFASIGSAVTLLIAGNIH